LRLRTSQVEPPGQATPKADPPGQRRASTHGQANGPMPCSSACPPGSGSAVTATPAPASDHPAAAASGCPGAGGSIAFTGLDAHIGCGYTMNQKQAGMPVDLPALRVIDAPCASL